MGAELKHVVRRVLSEYAALPPGSSNLERELVFDDEHQRYLLINVGWRDHYRIYATMIHVDIIDGKLWIQHDLTEDGVALDFVRIGIPHDQIVLAFAEPAVRKDGEFAPA